MSAVFYKARLNIIQLSASGKKTPSTQCE